MTFLRSGCAAAAFVLTAAPAFADLTAEQVWQDYRSLIEWGEAELTVENETRTGNRLRIEGLKSTMTAPDGEDVSVVLNYDWLEFTEVDAQTVEMRFAPLIRLTVTSDEDDFALSAKFEQTDILTTVREDGDARRYTSHGSGMSAEIESVMADGEKIPAKGIMTSGAIAQQYLMKLDGDRIEAAGDFSIDALHIDGSAADPDNASNGLSLNYDIGRMAATFDGVLVPVSEDRNPLADGFAVGMEMTYGPTEFSFSFADRGDSMTSEGTEGEGRFVFGVSPESFVFDFNSQDARYAVSGSDIPLPTIDISYGEIGFGMTLPLEKTDEPVEWDFDVGIRELEINKALWAMFDPAAMLPRDPMTAVLDVVGTLRWLVDLTDPDLDEDALDGDVPPVELHAMELREFHVSALGADLESEGAFTFDMSDLVTFDGLPRPKGAAEASLRGGHALLDTLVSMGLVPEDASFGIRAMLGVFARPGDGPDHLVSNVEIDETGAVLINGQRIR